MKEYDVIAIGTGSAIYVIDGMMQRNPNIRVAVPLYTIIKMPMAIRKKP
jgi:hypothetical protein